MIKKNLLLLIILITFSCKSEVKNIVKENTIKENTKEENPIEKIKKFYLTFYGVDEIPGNREELLKEYVSERILERMDSLTSDGENLILDYDPFIQGQDYFYDVIKKTLKVTPLKKENEYRVSFFQFGNQGEELTNVDLLFKKNDKGKYLIYSILNDDFFNFRIKDNAFKSINQIMEENMSSPSEVIDYLIFTKDNKGNLQINTEILDYISKNTTRENNSYLSALENYAQKSREDLGWSLEEHSKIKAYIFNTSYPLRKKYWLDKYEEWYDGKPEVFLGDRGEWRENNNYDLPNLGEYVGQFLEILGWEKI